MPFSAVIAQFCVNTCHKSVTVVVLCNILSHPLNCFTVFLQRGKTVPEELVRAEDLSKYRQVASHAVSIYFCSSIHIIFPFNQKAETVS